MDSYVRTSVRYGEGGSTVKILAKIFAISIFDFICIYGVATILVAIVYRIVGWGLDPYLFIAALGLGRIFELHIEKTEEARKQMVAHAIMAHMHEFAQEDEDDGEGD